jgi:pimeloyl-ACP methyl ester carboxylesterase
VNYYRASAANPDVAEQWNGIINVPTLVIHGMKDMALTPKILEGLEEYVKDLKVVRIENASHWVLVDDPDSVISNILEFIL